MSLNQTYAMNQKKVRRYGKLFGSIDFDINTNLSAERVKETYMQTIAGTFKIGGKEFSVTLAELERISETADNAKSTFMKSYTMGRYGT